MQIYNVPCTKLERAMYIRIYSTRILYIHTYVHIHSTYIHITYIIWLCSSGLQCLQLMPAEYIQLEILCGHGTQVLALNAHSWRLNSWEDYLGEKMVVGNMQKTNFYRIRNNNTEAMAARTGCCTKCLLMNSMRQHYPQTEM